MDPTFEQMVSALAKPGRKILEEMNAGDARRIMAAANVVKPEVEWFRELCMTAGRSIALATEQTCET